MGKLTAKTVESAKPGRHADGAGLYLLVKPSGARSWLLRVQVAGQRRDIGMGSVDSSPASSATRIGDDLPLEQRSRLTLAQARELAVRLRNVAKAGRDPAAERRKDRRPPPSFKDAAIATHKALKGGWSKRTADAFLASLEEHAYPSLGRKRIDDVDANDVVTTLKAIWKDKPSIAKKVRQRIATVLNFSKAKGWRVSEAPAKSIATMLGKATAGGNMPAMPYDDVPAYFVKLSAEAETAGRLALLLVIATAARSGEVRNTKWGHIDWTKRLWNRPGSIMKERIPHTVTLNDQAIAILRRAASYTDTTNPDALIFSNRKGGALSDMTISKVMRDAKLPYVPHGFRSSFRDWAAEAMPLIPDPVAEAALSHSVPDSVVKAYKRAQFLEMRRQLLDGWGSFLVSPASKGEVL